MHIATSFTNWCVCALVALIEALVDAPTSAGATVGNAQFAKLLCAKLVLVLLDNIGARRGLV
jgi:hypothetical protein